MKLALAVGALAASGTLVALTVPAQADPPDHARADGVVSRATGADTKAEQRAVRKYWTAKRMRNATPRDAIRPSAKPIGNAKPGASTSDASLGSVWPTEQKTVGKVFFSLGGSNYVCSGNAVDWSGDIDADTENVISTAGHCVNDGGTTMATNFLFIPAYDATKSRTAQKYGSFVGQELVTSPQWAAQGPNKWDYDIGFARMGTGNVDTDKDGTTTDETLGQAVGSTDIRFGAEPKTPGLDYTIDVHSFGYPAARPYDGTKLVSCWGGTTADTVGGSGDYRLRCNMTGGSSGGPWLEDADGNDTVGTVQVSVNSFGYRGEKNAMYGPVLGSTAESVYVGALS